MQRGWLAPVHLTAFLLGTAVWVALVGVASAGAMIALDLQPTAVEQLGARAIGVLSILQIVGIAGLALGLAALLPRAPGSGWWPRVFPLALAPRGMLWTGALGGALVWTFPSWLAERLGDWFPGGTLDLVAAGLADPDPVGRAALVGAIAVSAPFFEELVFRGYVWRVLEVSVGPRSALVGSTLLFAVYHLDPVHVVALLPTAALLGWLRSRSGSLVPGMVAHFVNNALGVVLATAGLDTPERLPLWAALGGAAATVVVAWLGSRISGPSQPPSNTST